MQEFISIDSSAKRSLRGAAALINKCDSVDAPTFLAKQAVFVSDVRPIFNELQALLGFGETRFDVFYTSLIHGRDIARPSNTVSDFAIAIDFMFQLLVTGGVVK